MKKHMNIFVGCSSKDTQDRYFNKVAEDIGHFIVNGSHNLVFGGCHAGLMGKVYSVVHKKPDTSKIFIATIEAYKADISHLQYDEAILSKTVGIRKDYFFNVSDVLVFLPGGIGTLDEIITAIEAKRTQEHNAPIIIINAKNYFDPLLDMLDKTYSHGFANGNNRHLYFVADNLRSAKNRLSRV